MNKATAVTVFQTAEGYRMSTVYSVIDEATGTITKDNVRIDRILVDDTAIKEAQAVLARAQSYLNASSSVSSSASEKSSISENATASNATETVTEA
jgi:hypothetical protein